METNLVVLEPLLHVLGLLFALLGGPCGGTGFTHL